MDDVLTLTFVCQQCGREFTKSYTVDKGKFRGTKAQYCPECNHERILSRQREKIRQLKSQRKDQKQVKPKLKPVPKVDTKSALKMVSERCDEFLAAHGAMQESKTPYVMPSERASAAAAAYGESAADRYKRLTAAKVKGGDLK